MKRIALPLLIVGSILSITFAKDYYHESLDLFQLSNNYFLNNFTFVFDLENPKTSLNQSSTNLDYFPIHFANFIKDNDLFESVTLDLV